MGCWTMSDKVAERFGLKIIDTVNNKFRGQMTIGPDMVNSQNICHGGVIFSFAQSTLEAFKTSTTAGDRQWHYSIVFLNSGKPGDEITAEVSAPGENVYDVTVRRTDGTVLAEMRANG